jgi:hypothetical protein
MAFFLAKTIGLMADESTENTDYIIWAESDIDARILLEDVQPQIDPDYIIYDIKEITLLSTDKMIIADERMWE